MGISCVYMASPSSFLPSFLLLIFSISIGFRIRAYTATAPIYNSITSTCIRYILSDPYLNLLHTYIYITFCTLGHSVTVFFYQTYIERNYLFIYFYHPHIYISTHTYPLVNLFDQSRQHARRYCSQYVCASVS